MRIIEWTKDFVLGVDEIDEQHRALVGMINALDARTHEDPRPETMRRLLEQLSDYARDHFALEERLMCGGGCSPDLIAMHFSEHAFFRSELKDLTTDFEKGRRDVTVPLIDYLVHWFLHHIAVVDRSMTQQLSVAEPDLAARLAAARPKDAVGKLTEEERHLLADLRHVADDVERQVEERTRALTERNHELEAELREMSALAERLAKAQAPRLAAD